MAESSVWRTSVEREVMWAPWEGPGLEHLRLVTSDDGVVANGLVISLEAGRPFRISYEIRCDGRWRVREVRVSTPDSERPVIELLADGEGRWNGRGGEPVPELDGCIDVDIYVRVPELLVGPERQRYGCLETQTDGGLYRFEALPSGFTAELPVDAEGLVIDYPGLFRRAWSG
jgi:uncharacterized protein